MSKKVPTVVSLDLNTSEADPQVLSILATGEVPTTGWSDGTLVKYEYFIFPLDGIQEYDFVANPPSGGSGQVISRIPGIAVQDKPPELRGIKVYGSQNEMTVRFISRIEVTEVPSSGDHIGVESAAIVNDQLVMVVNYGGGCRDHTFEVLWDGVYQESLPPQVEMRFFHNANGDTCRRAFRETFVFDLLDLDPCVIHLSTAFGFSADLDYRLSSLRNFSLPVLRGNTRVPLLQSDKFMELAAELANHDKAAAFKAGPEAVLRAKGLSEELDSIRRQSSASGLAIVLNNGISGSLGGGQSPDQGYSGTLKGVLLILEGLGFAAETLGDGVTILLQPGSKRS